ncbi:MAG: hypothetical protein ORN26_02510 [Candidatus Pacebacteria bacterium]|nr:hypothetical protein [Candidatus Paceibacterota bacterium]
MKEQFEVRLNINKKADGFVFVFFDKDKNKNREDSTFVSIPNQYLNGAFYGDIVKVELIEKNPYGE